MVDQHAMHPSLAAFALGLGIASVIMLDVWPRIRIHLFPAKPRADTDGAILLNELFAKSKRAKQLVNRRLLTTPLMYESHLTQTEIVERRLVIQLVDDMHDRLRAGDITAWGSPDGRKPHQQIEPHEWSEIELSAGLQDLNLSNTLQQLHAVWRKTNVPRGSAFGYLWIKFSRAEVLKEFPLAWFPRRRKDEPHEKRELNEAI